MKNKIISTGFKQLDKLTQGFRKSELITIGASPGIGKTTFAIQIAENLAKAGKKCVFFSLQLSEENLKKKISLEKPSRKYLCINDNPAISVKEMIEEITGLIGVDCIIIDCFDLIIDERLKNNQNWQNRIISRELKRMASQLNLPVICTMNLSKYDNEQPPKLSDFFEISSVIENSDLFMFLHREPYFSIKFDDKEIKNTGLIIAKNSYGDIGTIELKYNSAIKKFSEIDTLDKEKTVMKKLIDIVNDGKIEKETIPTGFKLLDRITQGFRKSDLIIIGARPAMGKNTFAVNLAENIALAGKKCAFFSLDLSSEQLAKKFSTVNSDMEIYIDDTPVITVSEMNQKIKDLKNVDCVVIDYFELIRPEIKKADKMQECYDTLRDLKRIAEELDILVICTTQIPRSEEYGKKPQISDLPNRDSFELYADIFMFLHRDSYYFCEFDEDDIDDNTTELIIVRNKHGSTGSIELNFDFEANRFRELDIFGNSYGICYT